MEKITKCRSNKNSWSTSSSSFHTKLHHTRDILVKFLPSKSSSISRESKPSSINIFRFLLSKTLTKKNELQYNLLLGIRKPISGIKDTSNKNTLFYSFLETDWSSKKINSGFLWFIVKKKQGKLQTKDRRWLVYNKKIQLTILKTT